MLLDVLVLGHLLWGRGGVVGALPASPRACCCRREAAALSGVPAFAARLKKV